jgi:hypothetical protein
MKHIDKVWRLMGSQQVDQELHQNVYG